MPSPAPSPAPSPPSVQVERRGRQLHLSDERGGSALVDLSRAVPLLVDWHAVPPALRYSAEAAGYKRRGFTRLMLGALAQLGVEQVSIPLQSRDSRLALARLAEQGIVSPVEGYTAGPSVDEHPTRFRLHARLCPEVRLEPAEPSPGLDQALLRGSVGLTPPVAAVAGPEMD